MDTNANPIEALYKRAEDYGKTTLELFKLTAIDKSADVVSSLVSRLAIVMVIALVVIILNIGVAQWIGELLGKSYYGFFVVAGFYSLIALLLYAFRHPLLKYPVSNSIVNQMLKNKNKAA